MRSLLTGAAIAGLVLAASPSLAATNLECIDEGYTAEEEKVFKDFYDGFTVASLDEEDSQQAHVEPVANRAADCTIAQGWSPDAMLHAVFYRMSTMLSHALELKTPLTSEQLGKLNEAIANADQAKLREILGPQIEASMNDEASPPMSKNDELYLGLLVLGAGLPAEQGISEYAGALLGARMMAEIAAERFAED